MTFYRPVAANGLNFTNDYREILPCPALRPYVHSFWGTDTTHIGNTGSLVIPDTCMDIIFTINYTRNTVSSFFCALDREARFTEPNLTGDLYATFGIRFFAWTASAFARENFSGTLGAVLPTDVIFPKLCRELSACLFDLPTLEARARKAEELLLEKLDEIHVSSDILNATHIIIENNANLKVRDISNYVSLSPRQLERLINRDMGCSPKLLQRLIRHQMIYRELIEGRFEASDAVVKYGYADQSHLLREFREFHILSPRETLIRLK